MTPVNEYRTLLITARGPLVVFQWYQKIQKYPKVTWPVMEHLWTTYHFCSCVFGSLAEHTVACPELSWIAGHQSFSFYPFVVRCCNGLPTEGHYWYPKILMMSDCWNQPFFGQVNQMLNKQKPLNIKTTAVFFHLAKMANSSDLNWLLKRWKNVNLIGPHLSFAKILGVILLCKSTARCQAHAAQRPEEVGVSVG